MKTGLHLAARSTLIFTRGSTKRWVILFLLCSIRFSVKGKYRSSFDPEPDIRAKWVRRSGVYKHGDRGIYKCAEDPLRLGLLKGEMARGGGLTEKET